MGIVRLRGHAVSVKDIGNDQLEVSGPGVEGAYKEVRSLFPWPRQDTLVPPPKDGKFTFGYNELLQELRHQHTLGGRNTAPDVRYIVALHSAARAENPNLSR